MKYALIFAGLLSLSQWTAAQTPWPEVQASNYPMVSNMQLVRHEQSILLGESDQQTGLFFAILDPAYSEKVQQQLLADAQTKGWKLQTVLRHGTSYVLTFSKGPRLLDIRLSNSVKSVEAVYSVVYSQQISALAPALAPAAQATPR